MYPKAAEAYRIYRQTVISKPAYPSTMIVSASGVVDLERAVDRTPGINVQIVTTLKGRDQLMQPGTITPGDGMGNRISSRDGTLAPDFERETEWRSPLPPLWFNGEIGSLGRAMRVAGCPLRGPFGAAVAYGARGGRR